MPRIPSGSNIVTGPGGTPPIRVMYGIFMDRIQLMISGVNNNIAAAETALKSGGLRATDAADVKHALQHLKLARKHLKLPGGRIPKEEKDSGSRPAPKPIGPRPLYGVVMESKVSVLRNQAQNTLGFIETHIGSGSLVGKELVDAKQARVDLKNVLHALTPKAPKA